MKPLTHGPQTDCVTRPLSVSNIFDLDIWQDRLT